MLDQNEANANMKGAYGFKIIAHFLMVRTKVACWLRVNNISIDILSLVSHFFSFQIRWQTYGVQRELAGHPTTGDTEGLKNV